MGAGSIDTLSNKRNISRFQAIVIVISYVNVISSTTVKIELEVEIALISVVIIYLHLVKHSVINDVYVNHCIFLGERINYVLAVLLGGYLKLMGIFF